MRAPDLQHVLLEGLHGGLGPPDAPTPFGPEGLQAHIRGGQTKKPELVGFKPVTRGVIILEIPLMIFNILFIFAPGTVDRLIQHPPPPVPAVRGNRPEIDLPSGRHLHFDHQFPGVSLSRRVIGPAGIPGVRFPKASIVRLDGVNQPLDPGILPQPFVHQETDDRSDLGVRRDPIIDCQCPVMLIHPTRMSVSGQAARRRATIRRR